MRERWNSTSLLPPVGLSRTHAHTLVSARCVELRLRGKTESPRQRSTRACEFTVVRRQRSGGERERAHTPPAALSALPAGRCAARSCVGVRAATPPAYVGRPRRRPSKTATRTPADHQEMSSCSTVGPALSHCERTCGVRLPAPAGRLSGQTMRASYATVYVPRWTHAAAAVAVAVGH